MTDIPIRERENMPEISAAAFNTLDRYPAQTKQSADPSPKPIPVMAECQNCHKSYNQDIKIKVLADLPSIKDFDYDNLCLTCIKEDSARIKASVHPVLVQLREEQDEMNRLYQESFNRWKKVSNEYQALDKQAAMIKHYLTKPVAAPKTAKPKKDKTSGQLAKALAMKLLNNLSPEQRAAIEANLTQA